MSTVISIPPVSAGQITIGSTEVIGGSANSVLFIGTDGMVQSGTSFLWSEGSLILTVTGTITSPTSAAMGTSEHFGSGSLPASSTGDNNTAFGNGAAGLTTTGADLTAVGYLALSSNDANNQCTAVGSSALLAATGDNNTAIGYRAGSAIVTGSNCTFLGASTNILTDDAIGSVAIGASAVASTGECSWGPGVSVLKVHGLSSTGDNRERCDLTAENIDNTNASRKYRMKLSAWDTGQREGMRIDADGSAARIGFFGVTAAARAAAYTPTNVTTDRSYDANATTIDELADVLGTLIADLQTYGLLQ